MKYKESVLADPSQGEEGFCNGESSTKRKSVDRLKRGIMLLEGDCCFEPSTKDGGR